MRMTQSELSDYLLDSDSSVRDAMKRLDEGGRKILFVESAGEFRGSLTDSDIRRFLLAGGDIDLGALAATNENAKFLREGYSREELNALLLPTLEALPVVSSDRKVVEIITRSSSTIIPVCEPNLSTYERDAILSAFDSGWISSTGPFVAQFEEEFQEFLGFGNTVSTSNGTQALALALIALGIGPGDEVIIPNLTFGATANAVIQVGARPVLADVLPEDWNICPEDARRRISHRTKAVIPVHLYGFPAASQELQRLAQDYGLKIVEDAAEALGTYDSGEHVGRRSDAVCFSFFGNKLITTGEGGMVAFSDRAISERAKRIRAHGFSAKRRYWHEDWGTNVRLTNLQAALGSAQLRRVEVLLSRKVQNAATYNRAFVDLTGHTLEIQKTRPNGSSSYWLYTILLPEGIDVPSCALQLEELGIETRPVFPPLHTQPAFSKYASGHYPVSSAISKRGLSLPSSSTLSDSDVRRVAEAVVSVIATLKGPNQQG